MKTRRGKRSEVCFFKKIILYSIFLSYLFALVVRLLKSDLFCFGFRHFGPQLWWRNGWIFSLNFMILVKMKLILKQRVRMMVCFFFLSTEPFKEIFLIFLSSFLVVGVRLRTHNNLDFTRGSSLDMLLFLLSFLISFFFFVGKYF